MIQPRISELSAWLLSLGATLVLAGWYVALDDALWHWFMLPVIACGVVIGKDVVDWFSGRFDVVHPRALIALLGYHLFFFVFILHVHWNYYYVSLPDQPADYRPWFGALACLNLIGLILYRAVLATVGRRGEPIEHTYRLDLRRFVWLSLGVMAVAGLAQAYVYQRYGGITAFVAQLQVARSMGMGGSDPFQGTGLGPLLVLAESFPTVMLLMIAAIARERPSWRRPMILVLTIGLYLVARVYFGGLRGQRTIYMFDFIWIGSLAHYWGLVVIRRRHVLYVGLCIVVVMNTLFWFKHGGVDGLAAITSEEARTEVIGNRRDRSDPFRSIVLMDFGRANIQAQALYRFTRNPEYEYGHGITYLGAVFVPIPSSLVPFEEPPNVIKYRTELLYGQGSYQGEEEGENAMRVPFIFGLGGEAMLNFGVIGLPLSFVLLALLIAWVDRYRRRIGTRGDVAWIPVALLNTLGFVVLIGDSHLIMRQLVWAGMIPFCILLVSSRKLLVRPPSTATRRLPWTSKSRLGPRTDTA